MTAVCLNVVGIVRLSSIIRLVRVGESVLIRTYSDGSAESLEVPATVALSACGERQ